MTVKHPSTIRRSGSALSLILKLPAPYRGARELNLLLATARIVDGTGNPWHKGGGVRDGRIVAVGSAHDMPRARMKPDIGRNVLCPGFIDSHSHSDLRIIDEPLALPKIMQGVTTKSIGLDSMPVAPLSAAGTKGRGARVFPGSTA